jgi:type II secretion system protein G
MKIYKIKQKSAVNGFTLIEIIVVMLIIGILAAIGIGSFTSSQIKSRDARRKSDLKQITNALEVYYNDFGSYPVSLNGAIMGCGEGGVLQCTWGDPFAWTPVGGAEAVVYMIKIPEDTSNQNYYYESGGTSYQIYARLENQQDRDVPKSDENLPLVYQATDCGDSTCNYGVASTNSLLSEAVAE